MPIIESFTDNDAGQDIAILSNEVHDIVSSRPEWIVRHGIALFCVIILLLVSLTFFIAYPDVVQVNAKLVSINAPKEVRTKTGGKLVKLLRAEGDMVDKYAVVGFVESRADHVQMIRFSALLDSMKILLEEDHTDEAVGYFSNEMTGSKHFPPAAGEIEPAMSTFLQSFQIFKQYLSSGFYLQKRSMLRSDVQYLRKLRSNLLQQKSMQEEDLGLAKETFDANSSLKDEKVIAAFEYRNEKSKYINKALTIPQMAAAIINNESQQHEKEKEIAQLENDIAQQKGIFAQALNNMKAQLDDWKDKYLLIAPVAGKIAFAGFLQQDQQLAANQVICYVNPQSSNYYAAILIPQNNLGKVKTGQRVLLKLPSYPFQEFGSVRGRIAFISNVPSDSGYLAKVELPDGLKTNSQKTLQYMEGLVAQGEIITKERKLSERLFSQLSGLLGD